MKLGKKKTHSNYPDPMEKASVERSAVMNVKETITYEGSDRKSKSSIFSTMQNAKRSIST